jgi:hypothetical protein
MTASYWDKPDSTDDSPVVRHAPDDHNYHLPDGNVLSQAGGRIRRFATIPAARNDGRSKGFDANEPGLVHVDPDAPDGGVIFDPNTVSEAAMDRAVADSEYPHEVFYRLGTPAPALGFGRGGFAGGAQQDETPRVNPMRPKDYVVPKAAPDGAQYVNDSARPLVPREYQYHTYREDLAVKPVPPLSSLSPLPGLPNQQAVRPEVGQVAQPAYQPPPQPAYQPQPVYQPPQPAYPPAYQPAYAPPYQPPQPAYDPGALRQVLEGLSNISDRLSAVEHRHAPPPMPQGPPPSLATMPVAGGTLTTNREPADYGDLKPIRKRRNRPDAEDDGDAPAPRRGLVAADQESRQTLRQYKEADPDESTIITGFETLECPWLTGPLANKPKCKVVFEIPGGGQMLAHYHGVVEAENCVSLVYDTRYEEGQQYLPPILPEHTITLRVPHLKKSFRVRSMGIQYPVGVIDHVVLYKDVDVAEQDPE